MNKYGLHVETTAPGTIQWLASVLAEIPHHQPKKFMYNNLQTQHVCISSESLATWLSTWYIHLLAHKELHLVHIR